jgi:hypothetical protein
MHKATVRANKYFWDKFERLTGLPSERAKQAMDSEHQKKKYLQFITSDNITPHCSYRNTKSTNNIMTPEVVENGIAFCEANGYTPIFLGTPQGIDEIRYQEYLIMQFQYMTTVQTIKMEKFPAFYFLTGIIYITYMN